MQIWRILRAAATPSEREARTKNFRIERHFKAGIAPSTQASAKEGRTRPGQAGVGRSKNVRVLDKLNAGDRGIRKPWRFRPGGGCVLRVVFFDCFSQFSQNLNIQIVHSVFPMLDLVETNRLVCSRAPGDDFKTICE